MKYLEEEFPEICNTCGAKFNIWLIEFNAKDANVPSYTQEFIGPWCEGCIAEMSLLSAIDVKEVNLMGIDNILLLERIRAPYHTTKPMEEVLDILQECGF